MTARFSLVGRDCSGRPVVAKLGVGAVGFNPFELHPGGRWERILTACADADRALSKVDLAPFSKSPHRDHGEVSERQKMKRALWGLARAGLLTKSNPTGKQAFWQASHVGVASVQTYGLAA